MYLTGDDLLHFENLKNAIEQFETETHYTLPNKIPIEWPGHGHIHPICTFSRFDPDGEDSAGNHRSCWALTTPSMEPKEDSEPTP